MDTNKIIKLILILIFITSILISCGGNPGGESTESKNDSTSTSNTNSDQITGIGLKNTAQISVYFFFLDGVQNSDEKVLEPADFGTDFKVAKSPCILRIKGQEDQWNVEKGKRYIFRFEDGKWDLFEV